MPLANLSQQPCKKRGKKAEKKGSRFLEIKSTVVDRMKKIHNLLKETKEKEKGDKGYKSSIKNSSWIHCANAAG